MSKLKTTLTGLIIGATIGYTTNKIKQPEYTLQEQNNKTYLQATNTKKEYKIQETKNNFYLGSLEHNLKGVKKIAYQHGLYLKENKIQDILNQKKELEDKLKEQDQKIKRRRFFDKIDRTWDQIKYWYRETKRKQLD